MEAEGAKTVWNRSIEKHNIRYKWMVNDGDSKVFSAVKALMIAVKLKDLTV